MNTSEKPEVARRAANTVLNIAGIATKTKSEVPTPPTPQPTKEEQEEKELEPTPEDRQMLQCMARVIELKGKGLNLETFPSEKLQDLITLFNQFNPSHDPENSSPQRFNDVTT